MPVCGSTNLDKTLPDHQPVPPTASEPLLEDSSAGLNADLEQPYDVRSKSALKQFFLLAFLWIPLGFFIWVYLSSFLFLPVGWATDAILLKGFPSLFKDFQQIGNHFQIVLNVLPPEGKSKVFIEPTPLLYSYGLALFFGLVMATPMATKKRALQLFVGFWLLVPVQVFGVVFEALKNIGFNMGVQGQTMLAETGLPATLVALCYQLGYLLLPSLVPVVIWVAMNRPFFALLSLHMDDTFGAKS
jgi:hypothetical protein